MMEHEKDCICPICVRNTQQRKWGQIPRRKLPFKASYAGHSVDANTGKPTPQVTLRVCLRDENGHYKRTEQIRAMPDSGALISCVLRKWEKRQNLQITEDKDNIIDLFNAEGRKIKVTGTTLMKVQHPKGTWVPCVVLVCPKLGHKMLLSWVDQK